MSSRRNSLFRFARGLLIYIVVFAVLSAVVIGLLGLYLKAYEESRSTTCVRAYLEEHASGALSEGWQAALSGLDSRLQAESDRLAFVHSLLGSATYRELRSDAASDKLYGLYDSDGNCFERLTLHQGGETHWGFTSWLVGEEDFDIHTYLRSFSLTVPENYRVSLGGKELGAEFVTARDLPYETLEACSDLVEDLPVMIRYEGGPCLTKEEPVVRDEEGREVPETEQDELHYLANCSKADEKRLEEFALTYLDAYLPYAGDENGAWQYHWQLLYPMIVRHGELEERLVLAREGFGFNNTNSVEIVSHVVNLVTDLKDGHYLVDLDYRTETVGLHGPVQEDNRVRLLVQESSGQLLAEAMYHY